MSNRQSHDELLPLASVCADEAEILAISVARFIAAASMTGDAACWDAAHDGAERLLGPVEGPRLVGGIAGLMRAIRAERIADWRFLPAPCCRVTTDERDLAALLALARRGPSDALRQAAADLAGKAEAPSIEATVSTAAELLDAVQPALSAARFNDGRARPDLRTRPTGVLH